MSVHCIIAIQEENGSLTGIYCQCNGYIDSVGETLYYQYQNPDKIRSLMGLGDIEALDENVSQPEFDSALGDLEMGRTVAFHRDRGLEFAQIKAKNLKEFNRQCGQYFGISYVYLYVVNERKWYVDNEPLENFFERQ